MSGASVRRHAAHLVHHLHWVSIAAAVWLLIGFEFALDERRLPSVRVYVRAEEFSWGHHGLYLAIVVITLFGSAAFRLQLWRNANTLIPRSITTLPAEKVGPRLLRPEFREGSDVVLDLEPVTHDTFAELLALIERAYPSYYVAKMKPEQRADLYSKWLNSKVAFMAFVRRRTDGRPGFGTRVGFVAACPMRHQYFRRMLRGDATGTECAPADLGYDGTDYSFVDVRHLYIRRGAAGGDAMVWLLGQALRALVRPGTAPVVYGHTVSDTGKRNYRTLGFSNNGETLSLRAPQFVLDGRRQFTEQSAAAVWSLQVLCGTVDRRVNRADLTWLVRPAAPPANDAEPNPT